MRDNQVFTDRETQEYDMLIQHTERGGDVPRKMNRHLRRMVEKVKRTGKTKNIQFYNR